MTLQVRGHFNVILGGFPVSDIPTGINYDNITQTFKAKYRDPGTIVDFQPRPNGQVALMIADQNLTNGKKGWIGFDTKKFPNFKFSDLQGVALSVVPFPFGFDMWPDEFDSHKVQICVRNSTMILATVLDASEFNKTKQLDMDIVYTTHQPGNHTDETFALIRNNSLIV